MKFGELKEKLEKNLKEICAEMYKEDMGPREWDIKLSRLDEIVRALRLLYIVENHQENDEKRKELPDKLVDADIVKNLIGEDIEVEIDEDYDDSHNFIPLKIKYNVNYNGWLSVKDAGLVFKIVERIANWWRNKGYIRIYKIDPNYIYIHLIRIER